MVMRIERGKREGKRKEGEKEKKGKEKEMKGYNNREKERIGEKGIIRRL